MSISIELEELKADFLDDLKRSLEKKNLNINDEFLQKVYLQFFYDFLDDFCFDDFCLWLKINLNGKDN